MKEAIVAIDAMGGDNAPKAIVEGAIQALNENFAAKILLVGRESDLHSCLSGLSYHKNRVEIVNAPEVIETGDVPTAAIKEKKNSSMVVAMNMVREGNAAAVVSAGNTGALLTGATVIIGRIKGIERPALATILPNAKSYTFFIDVGANVDCKPAYLAQFAQMGSVYMEHVMGIENPRVGLVNIGAEREKGNTLTKEAYGLLENAGVNFTGNVEPRDIPFGAVDVAVCDAFVGNVILKYSEGFAKSLLGMIKKELMSGLFSKVGAALASGAFKNLKKSFDYSEVGGAPFLGLKGLVVKAHGSSNATAIKNAVRQCSLFIEKDIVVKISEKLLKESGER